MVEIEEIKEEEKETNPTTDQNNSPHTEKDNGSEEENKEGTESKLQREEIEERFRKAQLFKNEGNQLFNEAKYEEAIEKYTEAINLMTDVYDSRANDCSIYFCNRAACYLAIAQANPENPSPLIFPNNQGDGSEKTKREEKKKEYLDFVVKDCTEALELNPKYTKALSRRATANEILCQFGGLQKALDDYNQLLLLDPTSHVAKEKVQRLPAQILIQQEKDKEEMLGKLKSIGNSILGKIGLSTDNFKFVKDETTGGYSVNFSK